MKGKHGKHHERHERHEERKHGGGVHHEHHKHHEHKRARGGRMPEKADGNPEVIKEAEKTKSIGKIGGVKGHGRADRKRGGGCHRASGGGADTSPYSSAGRGLRRGGC